jgi:hypothetical protein
MTARVVRCARARVETARIVRCARARVERLTAQPERGQISVLIIGMCAIALTLVLGGIGVTAAQIARIHLMDAADAAALDASDALAERPAYLGGVSEGVRVSDASVREEAASSLRAQPLPKGISAWALAPGTGSPDGRTAVVRLQGQATIPLLTPVLRAFGGGVTITVESRARSDTE